MSRGELQAEPLLAVLSRIAQEHATGALHVARTGLVAEEGQVYIHAGQVYAATAGRERFPIGARLVTAYGLPSSALDEALAAQAGELTGWRVGEILVHLGHIDAETIEEASREQLLDAVTDMSGWSTGSWRFRLDERTRTMVSAALPWSEASALIHARQAEWEALLPIVRGAHAVPLPVAVGQSFASDEHLDPVTAALLTRVDGVRTLAEVAHDRGLSVLETGRAIAFLTTAGAVRIGEVSSGGSAMAMLDALAFAPDPEPLQDVVAPVVDLTAAREARAADEAARVQARRDADETELADAARRSAETQPVLTPELADEAARSLAEQEARVAEQAAEVARIEAARLEAEAAETARVEAEQIEAEAAETARVEAERVEAETAETARIEAERAEAERAEAARIEAERAEAEAAETARIEAERLEAERIAAEAAETARVEADVLRVAAEAQAREAAASAAEERRTRVEAAQAAQLDEEARRRRREILAAEREVQRAAEAEATDLELSLADQLRSASVPLGSTNDLAAALSAALDFPVQPSTLIALPETSGIDQTIEVTDPIEIPDTLEDSETVEDPSHELAPAAAMAPPPGPTGPGMGLSGMPSVRSGETDMASLFRELSSLGEEEQVSAPRGAHARPPGADDPRAKKKKNLFGR